MAATLVKFLGKIHQGDCVAGLKKVPSESVDLAFADPPFNIGFKYDQYDDQLGDDQYLAWSREWMAELHRVLKNEGTFWLAIGDEYAAELKIEAKNLGFHCRSWVIWYYTFGVNCKKKFTRSHAHLFHFVKDPKNFLFNHDDMDLRVPSAQGWFTTTPEPIPMGECRMTLGFLDLKSWLMVFRRTKTRGISRELPGHLKSGLDFMAVKCPSSCWAELFDQVPMKVMS